MTYHKETMIIERVMMVNGEAVPHRFVVTVRADMLPFNLLKRVMTNKTGVARALNDAIRVELKSRG